MGYSVLRVLQIVKDLQVCLIQLPLLNYMPLLMIQAVYLSYLYLKCVKEGREPPCWDNRELYSTQSNEHLSFLPKRDEFYTWKEAMILHIDCL